jgi:Alr-MurF fusion protein
VYTIQKIAEVTGASFMQRGADTSVQHLSYDSRSLSFPATSLFFAIRTGRQDGHQFVNQAYQKGVRNFIVDKEIELTRLENANVLQVDNTVSAMQKLAAHHRSKFHIPVIGITGSNGKTVVKEWLYQLLHEDYRIIRSPKSYNSQIGAALSVWQMRDEHELAIFEAGISMPGEMDQLEHVIRPTMGVLTNIGAAHDEGFSSLTEKKNEKLKLFRRSDVLIGEDKWLLDVKFAKKFLWGKDESCRLKIVGMEREEERTVIKGYYLDYPTSLIIPFTDEASIQNAINCWSVMLVLDYSEQDINTRFQKLHAVDMRLEMKNGLNGCVIINDSYSADLTSFHMALHFMGSQHRAQSRTVILSDFMETGRSAEELYKSIGEALSENGINKVIGIGDAISNTLPQYLPGLIQAEFYSSTRDFTEKVKISGFQNETILVKGARKFNFESVVQLLERKLHQTVLEINLNALASNLKAYQKAIRPGTKIMAMVKAFAYGSGGSEIASVLQYNQIDYLAVAYTDEGVDLRRSGIHVPVMVMNMDPSSFNAIVDHNLQPVIYSFDMLDMFEEYIQGQGLSAYPVHLEIETGMNRLGFAVSEMNQLGERLEGSGFLSIESVFTHLSASDDPAQDEFTHMQAAVFGKAIFALQRFIPYPFLKHIANSAAIIRFPEHHMDMVRVGIGLYGIEPASNELHLQPVATLRSTISQIKNLKAGDTVSYNRSGVIKEDAVIATVRIGYADGYSRRFSNGAGKMWIKGHLVPVIGTVCMDMTMIDITGIDDIEVGDQVVVFGAQVPVQQLAEWSGTIPYEILTSVSQRVKRVYFQE